MTSTKSEYAHPEVLYETDWVADVLNNPKIKTSEVDCDSENTYR